MRMLLQCVIMLLVPVESCCIQSLTCTAAWYQHN